jgi:hypothetical protein
MADEVQEFWKVFERETGEKVVAKSEGIWLHVPDGDMGHEGILILTDKSFRFKYVRDTQRSVLGMGRSTGSENIDRSEFTVARSDVVSMLGPKRGFFAWLFRRAMPRCSIVAREHGNAAETTYTFSADPSSGLIAALGKAFPAPAKKSER